MNACSSRGPRIVSVLSVCDVFLLPSFFFLVVRSGGYLLMAAGSHGPNGWLAVRGTEAFTLEAELNDKSGASPPRP